MKEAYYTILTQAVQMGGGLIIFKILTTQLDSHDFGIYALILSFSAFIFALPFTAIQQALTKYSSTVLRKRSLEVYKTVLFIDGIFFVGYLIFFVVAFIMNLLDVSVFHLFLIAFYIILEVQKNNNYTFANALRERNKYFFAVVIEYTLKITLLLIYHNSIDNVLTVFVAANIVSILLTFPRNLSMSFSAKPQMMYWAKMIFVFSSPLALWGIFGWMRDMSNRFTIEYFLSLDQVAVFSVMNTIAVIVPGALQAFFGMYFMPILYRKEKAFHGSIKIFMRKAIPLGLIFILLCTGLISIFAPEIITITSHEKYVSYSWMLAPMFFAFSLFSLSMSTTAEIFAHNKTKLLLMPNIVSGLISIFVFILLVKYFGVTGALWAFMVSYISYSIITFVLVYRFKP